MPELINLTRSPLVIAGEDGKRVTIAPGQSGSVSGDFSNHPWVKKCRIEIVGARPVEQDGAGDDELERLRMQYQNIFGKPPHKNSGAESIQKKIDEWKNQAE